MKETLTQALAIGAGGFFGSLARWGLARLCDKVFAAKFPIGILIVNVSGCVIIGWLYSFATARSHFPDTWRLGIGVGFVGAYTTFSTLMYESIALVEVGAPWKAAANIIGSIVLGLAAVMVGAWFGQR